VISDHDAIRTLNQRYARAADERDVDALALLFTPDATVDGARGAQTIAEWLDTMRSPRSWPTSMHVLGDPLIVLAGDTAHVDTYAVVHQLADPTSEQADLTLGIRYLDDLVRVADRWAIKARTARTLWMR
jgi:ketosteroid isomerase-like protein